MESSQIKAVGIAHLKSKLNTLADLLADIEEQSFTSVEQVKSLITTDAERMRKMLREHS